MASQSEWQINDNTEEADTSLPNPCSHIMPTHHFNSLQESNSSCSTLLFSTFMAQLQLCLVTIRIEMN